MLLTHTNRHEASFDRAELDRSAREDQPRNDLVVVLGDLHRLLEDYAPRWYTYEHHRTSELALRQQGHQAEAFLTLYKLLEEHAPRWYTSELHREARLTAEHLMKKLAGRPQNGSRKPTAYP